ncbi:glutamine amidotransferase class-II [Methanohalobium evestigatum Z-7303]|uniref:Glutamine amidotransferase class-II n=2 Tax=Methanohalobium evestigatum TaxID=2322 RepID=D7E677_METEZ|nr:glutamine amidotransferase class-II [Methanohalobium evestigatum Z-7303]
MCELLGLSFNISIKPSISFTGFRSKGEQNPDGWGIAYYPVANNKNKSEKSAQIIKEPINSKKSNLSSFLTDYQKLESKLIISHVRKSSKKNFGHKNTHPFSRELNGCEYIFAHNGTFNNNKDDFNKGRFIPMGVTDSENIFCHILGCIEENGITQWDSGNGKENFEWLSNKLNEVNENGKLNCIFSDSEYLFCYQDNNGHHNNLYYLHRKPPYDKANLSDEELKIKLDEEKYDDQTGYVVATKRLTNEYWESFEPGELIVFKDGEIIYSNKRDFDHPTETNKGILEY